MRLASLAYFCAACVLFLVPTVNSPRFEILRSYTLLLKSPIHMCSWRGILPVYECSQMDVVMELLQNTMYISSFNTQSLQCNRAEGAKCACTCGKRNPAAITCVASIPKLPFLSMPGHGDLCRPHPFRPQQE